MIDSVPVTWLTRYLLVVLVDVSEWYLVGLQQLFIALYQVELFFIFYSRGVRALKSWWDNFGEKLAYRCSGLTKQSEAY